MCARGVHPSATAFFHAMPALWPGGGAAAVKWVGSFPGNRARGQPSISAILVLSEPSDGRPVAVMDARWLTVRRTAACSALSARFLARSGARSLTAGAISQLQGPPIAPGWLAPGGFACSVDYASPWSAGALGEMDLVCTDDRSQLESARTSGPVARLPPVHADLAELVTGRRPGRTTDGQRTLACNLGLALADLVAAVLVYRRARQAGLGTRLPL